MKPRLREVPLTLEDAAIMRGIRTRWQYPLNHWYQYYDREDGNLMFCREHEKAIEGGSVPCRAINRRLPMARITVEDFEIRFRLNITYFDIKVPNIHKSNILAARRDADLMWSLERAPRHRLAAAHRLERTLQQHHKVIQ